MSNRFKHNNNGAVYVDLCRKCEDNVALINGWRNIIENCPGIVELLEQLVIKNQTEAVSVILDEIYEGYNNGLSLDQIKEYAKLEFYQTQMEVIREALEKGLNHKQVKIFARPEFDPSKMKVISTGLIEKLPEEAVRIYAKKDFSALQMTEIYKGLKNGLSSKQVGIYAKSTFYLNQMAKIREGLSYAKNSQNSCWTEESVMLYAKPEYCYRKMEVIIDMIDEGLETELIKKYLAKDFCWQQLNQVLMGFKNGLTEEQIDIYASKNFSEDQMKEIRKSFEANINIEAIHYLAKPDISDAKMRSIARCLLNGGNFEKIKKFLNNRLSSKVYVISDFDSHNFTDAQVEIICQCIAKGLEDEFIKEIANYRYDAKTMNLIVRSKDYLNDEQIKLILTVKIYDYDKLQEIIEGFEEGLTVDDVRQYANSKWNCEEMNKIRNIIETCPKEIAEFVVNNCFNSKQIDVIMSAYDMGLNVETIKKFANPKTNHRKMAIMAKELVDEAKEAALLEAKKELFIVLTNLN